MSKLKHKLLFVALVFSLSSTLPYFSVFASSSANPKSINITDGKIAGEKIGYYFTIPETVLEFVAAERVSIGSSKKLVEKFKLICLPDVTLDKIETHSTLAYISVYKKLAWAPTSGMEELFKTKDYVFVIEKASCSFDEKYNIYRYEYCLRHLGSADVIRNLFELPSNQQIEYSQTVFLNGKALNTKLITQDGIYYLPFRELAETLGYTVSWVENEKKVVLANDSFRDSFIMKPDTQLANSFPVKLIDGKTYMSLGYFVMKLALAVEVGRNKNIYVTD